MSLTILQTYSNSNPNNFFIPIHYKSILIKTCIDLIILPSYSNKNKYNNFMTLQPYSNQST